MGPRHPIPIISPREPIHRGRNVCECARAEKTIPAPCPSLRFTHKKDDELAKAALVGADWGRTRSPPWDSGFPPSADCCLITPRAPGYGNGEQLFGIMLTINCPLVTHAGRETGAQRHIVRESWPAAPSLCLVFLSSLLPLSRILLTLYPST